MTKPINSLKTIARYIEAKKPKTLDEAEHMLDLISVIADETIREIEAEPPYSLSAGALAKFDERIESSVARIAKNGFATGSGVSKSAKVVLGKIDKKEIV